MEEKTKLIFNKNKNRVCILLHLFILRNIIYSMVETVNISEKNPVHRMSSGGPRKTEENRFLHVQKLLDQLGLKCSCPHSPDFPEPVQHIVKLDGCH